MRKFVPKELREVMFPGTAKTSRPCSSASRAVMSEPEFSEASATET
jgi:hypothetical protein